MNDDNIKNFINNIAKLKWGCRRGMLELDVLLGNFLEKAYSELPDADKALFVRLLEQSDPELFDWLMGYAEPQDEGLLKITELIRRHARSGV